MQQDKQAKEKPTALNRKQREICWKARDAYFNCISNDGASTGAKSGGGSMEEAGKKCQESLERFQQDCPAVWVSYFIKRKELEKFYNIK